MSFNKIKSHPYFNTVIISIIIFIILLMLYNKPHIIITYNKNPWSEKNLEALSTLQKYIDEGLMGEVCDPLPCWISMDVENIITLNKPKKIQDINDRTYIIETQNKRYHNKEICPVGSHLITVKVREQWWSIGNCFLDGTQISFCILPPNCLHPTNP